jgi:hypothetical protein
MNRTGNWRSAVSPLLWAFALAAMLLAVSLSASRAGTASAQAQVGDTIDIDGCYFVSIEVLASDADFTSVFWRFGPDSNLGVTSKQAGETVDLGQVEDTELILGIVVQDTGNTFMTGPGSRNPDNQVHATISGNTVGFEDIALGEPNADWDYNDAMLELTLEPCPPREFNLQVIVDPASTGTGTTSGSGTYPAGSDALAQAQPGPASSFVAWSGDCAGGSPADHVLMDADKVCVALFAAVPQPTPTVEPTPEPTAEPLPSTVGIDNTLASPNPARVGEEVTFRVDVTLDVPAENTADVQYTFDDSELEYLSASFGDIPLSQCVLSGPGVIDCAFGTSSIDFSFDLHFEALKEADASTTAASLSSDPDADGPEGPIAAGPALADVDIIAISGSVPDTGDGSVIAGSTTSYFGMSAYQLVALLGFAVIVTAGAAAARLRTGARS